MAGTWTPIHSSPGRIMSFRFVCPVPKSGLSNHKRLALIDDEGAGSGCGLADVVVPVHPRALGGHKSQPQLVLLAARKALDDLCLFEFCDGAEHRQCELVFRVLDVVSAVDDELLPVLQNFG